MYQQTHTVQDQDVNQANHSFAQSIVRILQLIWAVSRKVATTVLIGFHTFVQSAEKQRSPHNDYWWDSPNAVKDVFNR